MSFDYENLTLSIQFALIFRFDNTPKEKEKRTTTRQMVNVECFESNGLRMNDTISCRIFETDSAHIFFQSIKFCVEICVL